MRRDEMTDDEWADYGDDLYHRTRENMLAPRSEWGASEWRLAQIEGRLQPQREETPCPTPTPTTPKSQGGLQR
jgi:hypothetical protein